MTIAIDAQIAAVSSAGIGQFTRACLEWLPRVDPGTTYRSLTPSGRTADLSMPGRWWWDQVQLPRLAQRSRADVLLKTGFSVPVRSAVPTVAFVHDLAARRFPEQLHRPSAWFYGRWVPWTLRFAGRLVAASEFTKRELVEQLGLPADRITVVLQGNDPAAQPNTQPGDAAVLAQFGIRPPYLLHVGTIEPRKNLAFLVRVLARLRQSKPDLRLVLAGSAGWKSDGVRAAVAQTGQSTAVVFTGPVSDDDRRALLRSALALVFPSTYEGFGRPPLEAMSSGLPVIAARAAAVPEVVGDAGLLLDGFDQRVWAASIAALIDDQPRRQELRRAGLARSRMFTWERAANALATILHDATRG